MVVKNKKKVFSGGRLGVYALLVALGGTGAVVGLDKDKKSEKAGTENAVPDVPQHFTVEDLEQSILVADEALEIIEKELKSEDSNPESDFYNNIAKRKIQAQRAEYVKRLNELKTQQK